MTDTFRSSLEPHARLRAGLLLFGVVSLVGAYVAAAGSASPEVAGAKGAKLLSVAIGKTLRFEGYEILFHAVAEDSRCPTGAQCVWAGNARVQLRVKGPDLASDPAEVELNSSRAESGTRVGSLRLAFVSLKPHPTTEQRKPEPQVLELSAELAPPAPAGTPSPPARD